jgi:glycosyltransferase involved in cell wall biosynthesis
MIAGAALCAVVIFIWAYLVIGTLHEGDRFRLQPDALTPLGRSESPAVSVVIPARNEAHQIISCIASLRSQTLPPHEIVVVDDGSTDGTAAAVRGLPPEGVPLRLVEAAEPPEGWIGKNHAVAQGVRSVTGTWILFTDADTHHAPGTLAAAHSHAVRTGAAMVSLTGDQRAEGAWEKIVQPLIFRLLDALYPLAGANTGDPERAAANGIYLLVRREAYEAIGTHEAFRGEVLEDVALARALCAAGHRTAFLRGDLLLRVRMYRGIIPLWEGWTKNLWPLLGRSLRRTSLAASAVLAAGLIPVAMLWYYGPAAWAAVAASLGAEAWMRSRQRDDPRWAVALPLGALIVLAMIAVSASRHLRGRGISWKGRTYPSSP